METLPYTFGVCQRCQSSVKSVTSEPPRELLARDLDALDRLRMKLFTRVDLENIREVVSWMEPSGTGGVRCLDDDAKSSRAYDSVRAPQVYLLEVRLLEQVRTREAVVTKGKLHVTMCYVHPEREREVKT